jgi:hypothetical protein
VIPPLEAVIIGRVPRAMEIDLHAAGQPFDEVVEWALGELSRPGPIALLLDHDGPGGAHVIRARVVPVEEWDA